LSARSFIDLPEQRSVKQLLLAPSRGEIAQKHRASRFTFTAGRRGQWDPIMKEN
jgi:hypothetical protein